MVSGKWIGGILGFMAFGPLGALAGIVIGSFFDKNENSVGNEGARQPYNYSFEADRQRRNEEGQRNSFMFSLLVLASYVIKADGKIMHSEMQVVRNFLSQCFGLSAQVQGEEILKKLFEEQKRQGTDKFKVAVAQCCAQIKANMDYSQRLQLLSFLATIAKADGTFDPTEVKAIRDCASWMGIPDSDVDSLLNLGGSSLEAAYKVLGVSPEATDDEVRKAYRRLALQHHPDRVATLGEDVKKAAEQKFQEINAAKEKVYQARGMR